MPSSKRNCKMLWRAIRISPALALTSLTSCYNSTPNQLSVLQAALTLRPPPTLLEPCDAPVTWPKGSALSANQVATLWYADRTALKLCQQRHAATVEFYTGRDADLVALGDGK